MRINEVLTELSFHGRRCTKDCSGHSAGYAWAKQHPGAVAASHSASFNGGAEVHADQVKANKMVRPKVRNAQGKFAPNPQMRKPKQPAQTQPAGPTKPVAPV